MMIVSVALLLLSTSLVLLDAMVTWRGRSEGFREVNPVLRYLLNRFGSKGFVITRITAGGLLLLLFWLLDPWVWILFSSTFSAVMGCVVLTGIKRIYGP
jgi:hypothetical protein